MSVFRATYGIVARMKPTRSKAWPSVIKASIWVRDLICLIGVARRPPLSCQVLASDASADGFGVVTANLPA